MREALRSKGPAPAVCCCSICAAFPAVHRLKRFLLHKVILVQRTEHLRLPLLLFDKIRVKRIKSAFRFPSRWGQEEGGWGRSPRLVRELREELSAR